MYDGKIRMIRDYVVSCICEDDGVELASAKLTKKKFEKEIIKLGWIKYKGKWYCPKCKCNNGF